MKDWTTLLEEETVEIDNYPLDEALKKRFIDHIKRHPVRVPKYYASLIDNSDPYDPIKLMAYPSLDELSSEGSYDTGDEASNTKLLGLQHKYERTALILSTNTCFMYCRFCFRKRMVGFSQDEINSRLFEAVAYIKDNENIDNVLISGGDPLTLSNEHIKTYLEALTEIKHLKFIRFGTRIPVVLPQRIYQDKELLKMLKYYRKRKNIIIVTHFNHPKELTTEAINALNKISKIGISVHNQTVLLNRVNDDPKTLAILFNELIKYNVIPYYLFQCRPVKGIKGFQVPLSKGITIVDETRKRLNGITKTFRYVMSHKKGKIEILAQKNNRLYLKFHQSKDESDENRFFSVVNENQAWLDNF
jgi:lysine 2,3-aminomutase